MSADDEPLFALAESAVMADPANNGGDRGRFPYRVQARTSANRDGRQTLSRSFRRLLSQKAGIESYTALTLCSLADSPRSEHRQISIKGATSVRCSPSMSGTLFLLS